MPLRPTKNSSNKSFRNDNPAGEFFFLSVVEIQVFNEIDAIRVS